MSGCWICLMFFVKNIKEEKSKFVHAIHLFRSFIKYERIRDAIHCMGWKHKTKKCVFLWFWINFIAWWYLVFKWINIQLVKHILTFSKCTWIYLSCVIPLYIYETNMESWDKKIVYQTYADEWSQNMDKCIHLRMQ